MLQDRFEQRDDVLVFIIWLITHDSLTGDAVEDREVQLFVGRVQIEEQIVNLVDDLIGPFVLLVDLVDQENRAQAAFQTLLEHEARLRHRSFAGIHQQDDGVDRLDDPFNLGGKIRVTRSIDDIDFVILVRHRTVLGVNCNAPFPFQIVAVHNAVNRFLVIPENVTLI